MNLSFKIILIQKFQIYVFRESSNFAEFKNVFGFNFNFEFKFKSAERKSTKQFHFLLDPNCILAHLPLAA
jgi:hypothetical protein